MYIRNLTLQNVKLFRDLKLDFTRNGEPRMWTVILGENGTCKTTILQAIAMAASGSIMANILAKSGRVDVGRSFRRRGDYTRDASVLADFGFSRLSESHAESLGASTFKQKYPGLLREWISLKTNSVYIESEVYQNDDDVRFWGTSKYVSNVDENKEYQIYNSENKESINPIDSALGRGNIEPEWFFVGYGVDRNLPQPEGTIGKSSAQDRVQSLFGNHTISATRWADHFKLTGNDELSSAFRETLRAVVQAAADLLPDVRDINLAADDAQSKRDPIERHRVRENVDGLEQELPTVWMSQGYQSSIAWISDLVGQVLVGAQKAIPPEEMEGLVLVDEIDLHLHPTWQVGLIQALRTVFKRMQFVVTTHSPLVITGCRADEIIRLERRQGEVVQVEQPAPDPLTLTGSELYWNYFDIERLIPNPVGQDIYDYRRLARNGARTEEEQRQLEALGQKLEELGLRPAGKVLPRGGR